MTWEIDQAWRQALSELAINLSAAWFGAVFVTPIFSQPLSILDALLLLVDVTFGMVFLRVSVIFKRPL